MAKVRTVFVLVFIVALVSVTFIACNPSKPTLSTSSNPDAGGTISPASGTYDKGVVVDVIATPASGYRFDRWEGSASGNSPTLQLTMDATKHLIAYFTKTYMVSVSSTPANSGSVTPNGGTYDEGNQVTLAAMPAQYYKFNGWSGDTSGTSDHLTLTLDSNKTIVASFVKLTYSVQTQVDASGGGTIDPASGTFEAGTHVQVTATAASGYRFYQWGGSATGHSNPLSLLVDGDKTVTAYFIRVYTLSVSSDPVGSGSIDPNGGVFDTGTVVTLSPVAVFPYILDHWTGTNNDSVTPTTVTMNSDKSVTAHFKPLSPGSPQTVNVERNNSSTSVPFQIQAGQWLQGEIILRGDTAVTVTITDTNGEVVKNLGNVTVTNFTFQAGMTGTHYLNVKFVCDTIHSVYYSFTYTIYS